MIPILFFYIPGWCSSHNFYVTLVSKKYFMSLDFHPLSLADRSLVWKYTENAGRRNCDLSFANLYAWRMLYRTEVAEWGGFLVFRFYADGHLAYLMPVGEGDWCAILQALKEDACRLSHPLLLLGVCEDLMPQVEECMGEDCRVNANRDHADYIYLRESLAALSGKKLQAKRNHVNRFKALYPDYRYEELTDEWVPACLDLTRRWVESRQDEAEKRAVAAEAEAIQRALAHREELDLRGGVLLVGEQIAAFTYGAPICRDTFDVCVEKADVEFEGAYTVINKEFVSRLPEQYKYVNREEDLGVEGLRKAKLSYQPEMLLMKYSVWSSCTVKAEIEECGLTPELHLIKWQTRALWSLCFGDTEEFMKLYFTRKYTPERNSCLVRDGRVVAALQRLPYRMMFGGGVVPVAYVSGVCTQPECRGKGLMTELMGQAHRKMYADGCLFSLLIPADEGLFAFYHRFGYYTCPEVALSEWEVSYDTDKVVCEVYTTMHEVEPVLGDLQSYLDAFLRRVPYAVLHDEADLYTVCADLFLGNGCVVVAREDERCVGLIWAVPREDKLWVLECFSVSAVVENILYKQVREAFGFAGNVAMIRQKNRVQLRVIHAYEVLQLYARQHADTAGRVRVVGDEDITENNGVYVWEKGLCRKEGRNECCCSESGGTCRSVHIRELPDMFLEGGAPYLSLMMN